MLDKVHVLVKETCLNLRSIGYANRKKANLDSGGD